MATAQPHDESDATPFVGEIFVDVWTELERRFPGLEELSERDRFAIATAITKAAFRGVLRGAAHAASEAKRQAGADFQLWIHGAQQEHDRWADLYGEEG